MAIIIREPKKNEKEEITKLFTTVITQNFKNYGFYEKFHSDIAHEVAKQMNTLTNYFEPHGQSVYFLVASVDNRIVGTIAYGKPNDDIKMYFPKIPDDTPEIKSCYILPEFQEKGIGTKLLHALLIKLQQKNFKDFCLESGYPKAQLFWTKKLGKPVVTIINRWEAGNDYLIWYNKIIH